MNLAAAIVFGILFGAGVHLLIRRDVIRLFGGALVLSNAAIYLLVATGFEEQRAPILPATSPQSVADPLAQALALTAVVIGFGTTVLLLRISWALERSHDTIDVEDLAAAEREARLDAAAPVAPEEAEEAEETQAPHGPDGPDRAGRAGTDVPPREGEGR
jgi:multicomponent Na+:H+ antiporter subunit C